MQRVEVQHHTHEQVVEYVEKAVEIATLDDVPDDLRVAVFTESVRLLASKTVQAVAQPQGLALPSIPH